MFETLKELPQDAILGIMTLFREDQDPGKIDLSVGVYQDEDGNTPILESVRRAEQQLIANQQTKSYVAIAGNAGFNAQMEALMFGALCHDLGKPSTTAFERGRIRSLQHDVLGVPLAKDFLSRMRAPHDLTDQVTRLVEHHLAPANFDKGGAKPRAYRRLARKLDHFVLEIPSGYGIGGRRNYYFSHMLNCVYDCRYCFLQGMFLSAHYLLFVNYEDFQHAIKETTAADPDDSYYFSGYDCDSLAFEPVGGAPPSPRVFMRDQVTGRGQTGYLLVQRPDLGLLDADVFVQLIPRGLHGMLGRGQLLQQGREREASGGNCVFQGELRRSQLVQQLLLLFAQGFALLIERTLALFGRQRWKTQAQHQ